MVGKRTLPPSAPSLLAGVRPIWIYLVWEYEPEHEALTDEGVIQLDDLTELVDLVEMSAA